MPRKKIEFTESQILRISQLAEEGNSIEVIVTLFNEEFGTNYSYSTIQKQIKGLGIERRDKRTEEKGNKIVLDKDELIRAKANYESDDVIARRLGVTTNAVKKNIKSYGITYEVAKEYRSGRFFNIPVADLRTLKSNVMTELNNHIQELVKDRGVEVLPNYTLKYDNTDITVDFYCPEIDTAFVCSTIDDLVSKRERDRLGIVEVLRWTRYITKSCGSYVTNEWRKTNENDITDVMEAFGDGDIIPVTYTREYTPTKKIIHYDKSLKVLTYMMVPDFSSRIYDIKATAQAIVGNIISLIEEGCIKIDVDFEDPYLKEIKKYEVVTREKVPSVYDGFCEAIKDAAKKDRTNYKKECEKDLSKRQVRYGSDPYKKFKK